MEKRIEYLEKLSRPTTNCFLGTTNNEIMFNYIGPQMIAPSTKPPPMPHIETKFTANSSYKDVFESGIHMELASGQ